MLRTFPIPTRPPRPSAEPPEPSPVPVEPRPVRDAATVMLVRDGADGVEVFLFRRIRSMVFAAGMAVFPGGATEEQDDDPALPWSSPVPGSPPSADALPPRFVVAAVRETFEECGVLLGSPRGGVPTLEAAEREAAERDAAELEALRLGLLAGEVRLAEVLQRTGGVVDPGLLHEWARWITPPMEPRRFDTRFFVARVPSGQEPRDLGGEGEQAAWVAARQAVARHHAGDLPMLPPTLVCLEDLAAAPDVDALLRTQRQVSPVSPWVVHRTGEDGSVVAELHVDLDGRGGGQPRS